MLIATLFACSISIAITAHLLSFEVLLAALAGFVYFAVVGVFVYDIRDRLQANQISKSALLLLLAFIYVLVPAILFPKPLWVPIQIIGWEKFFSAYSFCVDRSSTKLGPGFFECQFFLLINPTLVFMERGQKVRDPGLNWRATMRCLLGIAAMAAFYVIYAAMIANSSLRAIDLNLVSTPTQYIRFMAYFSTHLIMTYTGQSGRASFEIGMMRLLGYEIPERFRYPFLSISPDDFWRRWNIYLGNWAKRYIFFPLALEGQRLANRIPLGFIQSIAIIITFAAVGTAHDLSQFPSHNYSWSNAGLVAFLLFSIGLIIWIGVSRLLRQFWREVSLLNNRWRKMVTTSFSWLLFMKFLLFMGWILIPSLSGKGLPPVFSRLIESAISW